MLETLVRVVSVVYRVDARSRVKNRTERKAFQTVMVDSMFDEFGDEVWGRGGKVSRISGLWLELLSSMRIRT